MIKIKIMQEYSIFDLYRSQLFECSSCGKVAEHLLSSASKPSTQLELSPAKQYILENRQCQDKDTWKDNIQIHPQAVGRTDVCLILLWYHGVYVTPVLFDSRFFFKLSGILTSPFMYFSVRPS